ncbi:MAG: cellulase family glycosylhydrolase, partial [Chloroflexi bacterium]|nr:cellulase family glycosylhydrolase [Chloroflexota bacterium]
MSFEIKRGVNISHWLSQSERRGKERAEWFQERDVQYIARLGYDHIRLPFDEVQLWDKQGKLDAEALALMNSALEWCRAAGLRCVLDLHILRSHHFISREQPMLFTDPAEAERFNGLWRSLSAEVGSWPTDMVAYELLNEAVARDPEDWNRVAHGAYATLRELEPERTIVLGSNEWNSAHTYDHLRIPEGDPNLILTYHFYEPFLVTHYRAPWTPWGAYAGPIHYPGRIIPQEGEPELRALSQRLAEERGLTPAQVEQRYQQAVQPYDRNSMVAAMQGPLIAHVCTGLPIYCGEFGCYEKCPQAIRLAWYADILSVFQEFDIAWANWDYKGGFGIITPEGQDT